MLSLKRLELSSCSSSDKIQKDKKKREEYQLSEARNVIKLFFADAHSLAIRLQ